MGVSTQWNTYVIKSTVFHYFNECINVDCLEQTVRESALEKVTVCSIILTNGFMLTV